MGRALPQRRAEAAARSRSSITSRRRGETIR
jgi:hypothetical protein